VTDALGNPVPGVTVTFAGPASGASALIVEAGPFVTDAAGAVAVTAHANLVAGGPYDLVVTAGAATGTFHLTNLVGAPASVSINAGDNQSTTVDTDFATQLSVTVRDAGNNPVPGTAVSFAAPVAGASASIVEAGPHATDGSGTVVVTSHANGTAGGPYDVVATAGTATATFHLANLPLDIAQISSGSSCADFAQATAPTLDSIGYAVNKGKINALAIGSFSYWVKVTGVAGTNTVTVNQSITSGNLGTLFSLVSGSNVFRSDCSAGLNRSFAQSSINGATGTITVTFDAPAAGTYYVNVKLSTNPVKGLTVPTPTTVHYVFSTTGVEGSTRALDLEKT